MTSNEKRRRSLTRRLLIYGLAALLPALAILLLLEGGARLYVHLQYGVPGKSYGLWRFDEELGAQHAENAYNTRYQTNDYGFRNREPVIEPKPEGAWRMIAYGGSTTFCYDLGDSETWPARLEGLLRKSHHPSDQVLNAGAIAWSLGHAYARAKKDLPALLPDFVLIYSGINEDLNARALSADGVSMRELVGAGDFGRFARNLSQNSWLKRNSVVLKLMDHWLAPWLHDTGLGMVPPGAAETAPTTPEPAILENYLRTLEAFLDLAYEHGAKTLFVAQTHGRNNPINRYLTSYSRAGIDIARAKGALVVDAENLVESHGGDPMDLFSASGVHYSAPGADDLSKLIINNAFRYINNNEH